MNDVRIALAEFADQGICVASHDGDKAYEAIKAEIDKENRVVLSFSGVTRLTTAFLNSAIGRLYGSMSEEAIRRHMAPPVDAEPWHLGRLKLSIDLSKAFYTNEEAARAAYRGDDADSD